MKKLVSASALLALLGSTSVFAANLTIPMSFEYLALDGQKVESSVFNHKADLALTNGTHKIAIRYSDVVEDDFSDSQSFVKSTPFIVTIDVDGDYQYQLRSIDGEFVKDPHKFAENPQIVISRKDKGKVDYQVTQTNIQEESFMSRLFTGNSNANAEKNIAAVTASGAAAAAVVTPAPVAKPKPKSAIEQATASAPAAPAPKNSDARAEQMLQYWWLQADEQTRKEFMSWAIKQL